MNSFSDIKTNSVKIEMDGFSLHYSETPIPGESFQLHSHEDYEIFLFLEGDADYMVEGNQYHLTPHSILLLSPHVFHGVRVNRMDLPYKRIVVNVNPSFVTMERRHTLFSMFPGNLDLQAVPLSHQTGKAIFHNIDSPAPENSHEKYTSPSNTFQIRKKAHNTSEREVYYEHSDLFHIHDYFQAIISCYQQQNDIYSELMPVYVEGLLAKMTMMCQTLSPIPHNDTVSERLTDIIEYLNKHMDESITLDSLEKIFFINKHYLNRLFRKATGTTVMDYLQYKRITLAQELLLEGYPAQETAIRVGFPEYSTFYRAYCKLVGHSPKEDRR